MCCWISVIWDTVSKRCVKILAWKFQEKVCPWNVNSDDIEGSVFRGSSCFYVLIFAALYRYVCKTFQSADFWDRFRTRRVTSHRDLVFAYSKNIFVLIESSKPPSGKYFAQINVCSLFFCSSRDGSLLFLDGPYVSAFCPPTHTPKPGDLCGANRLPPLARSTGGAISPKLLTECWCNGEAIYGATLAFLVCTCMSGFRSRIGVDSHQCCKSSDRSRLHERHIWLPSTLRIGTCSWSAPLDLRW